MRTFRPSSLQCDGPVKVLFTENPTKPGNIGRCCQPITFRSVKCACRVHAHFPTFFIDKSNMGTLKDLKGPATSLPVPGHQHKLFAPGAKLRFAPIQVVTTSFWSVRNSRLRLLGRSAFLVLAGPNGEGYRCESRVRLIWSCCF
jgi:hypothetical protein